MNLSNHFKSLSHHAYAIIGDNSIREELISILECDHSIPIHGNADFFDRKYESFTVDDARELKAIHGMRPVHATSKKIFIITMNSITTEAQNALLKLLEEPAEYAHFFLIIPSEHLLLPTVKSRISVINPQAVGTIGGKTESKHVSNQAEALDTEIKVFLRTPIAKRLEIVKKLVDDISKEKKTKQNAIEFLNEIEQAVYSEKGIRDGRQALEAIEKARNYAGDRAPSLKMLLEFVALNV